MHSAQHDRAQDSVRKIATCALRVGDGVWTYAEEHAGVIERDWQLAARVRPSYFNGVIHLLDQLSDVDGVLCGRLLRTDFKSYLYWRTAGFPDTGVRDGFGSALIRSADGAILLGRQRAGNVNGGLAYLPGGFIDARDVDAGGGIDIAASIIRELAEETGLRREDVTIEPGFLVT
ncbi:MAG: NUDIX hydrolase, partial [Hyphomicrobium sp.]